MKKGYDGPERNISFDPEAQRQIREAMDKLRQESKVVVDPSYESQANKESAEKALFKMRLERLGQRAKMDANRADVSTRQADAMETWQGYLAYRQSLTVGVFQNPASVEDWERLRTSKREMAERDVDDRYASWHALEMMRWAADKPEALKTARETVKSQLDATRAELEALAVEVQRLWIAAPGSPELFQTQARLAERSKAVQRLEGSLRLIEKGE